MRKILKDKAGKSGMNIDSLLDNIIGFIVVFAILGGTATTLIAFATQVQVSGLPLALLFGGGGVLIIAFMAFLLRNMIRSARGGGR